MVMNTESNINNIFIILAIALLILFLLNTFTSECFSNSEHLSNATIAMNKNSSSAQTRNTINSGFMEYIFNTMKFTRPS